MTISMDDEQITTLDQVQRVLEGSEAIAFKGIGREQRYRWIESVMKRFDYFGLGRKGKGLLKAYMECLSGFSRAQLTRLLTKNLLEGEIRPSRARRNRFETKYTSADKELLAQTDNAHGRLSGPATRRILERQHDVYKDRRFERLRAISPAHIYNLRKSRVYREKRIHYQKTRPVSVGIGERRRPDPQGRPGYLRIDTVHQGDLDGVKGVYHINAVDEVTQWQVVGATAQISEAWLIPVLEAMLRQFPFRIAGFHSDNGSEFINHTVAKLLNKLLVEQTKSRPRHSNDNGLVEAKNGAVIRKHIGYGHIASAHAETMEAFYERHFNPYLNFHRPCGVPETRTDAKGKQRRVYRWYATPWEILRQLPDLARYLRLEITVRELERMARAESDTEAARNMQQAKQRMLAGVR